MHAVAAVLDSPRTFSIRDVDLPVIGADDGVLRVEACGLCGTDHEQFTGQLHPGTPFVPGHEIIGVIESLGAEAATRWGVGVGDRVAVEVFQSCRACDACLAGLYRRCARHGIGDMIGFVPFSREPSLWGGYASHLYLPPDVLVLPVPDALDPVLASVFNPLGAGLRWAAELPATGPGDLVAVLGPGIRGLCAAAAAKRAGAERVVVTGAGPADHDRLELAGRFGADATVDVTAHEHPTRAVRDALGGPATVVVDVTANAPTAFAQAIGIAGPGARIVLAGTGKGQIADVRPDDIVFKELTIMGALGVDATNYRTALDMLVEGEFPFAELPRQVVGLDGVEDLLRAMAGEGGSRPVHGVVAPG